MVNVRKLTQRERAVKLGIMFRTCGTKLALKLLSSWSGKVGHS